MSGPTWPDPSQKEVVSVFLSLVLSQKVKMINRFFCTYCSLNKINLIDQEYIGTKTLA